MKYTILDDREVVYDFKEIDPGVIFFPENEDRPYMKIQEDTFNAVDFDGDTYYFEDYDSVVPVKNYKFEILRG